MLDYFIYKLGQFLALVLPLRLAYNVAVFITDIRYIYAFEDKRAVMANLKVIFPDKPEQELRRLHRTMFRNFAKYLVDFFRISKLDEAYIKDNIRIENLHYCDEVLAEGRGLIILSAHIGNWEMGGAALGFLGYPLWVVALTHKDKMVNDFFNSQRECKGEKVIALGRAARGCLRALKENKIVALVGDRDFQEHGKVIGFFGKPTILPLGPAVLSLTTGSPIVPVFIVREKDDTFFLRIEEPIRFNPSQDREKDIELLMRTYISIFERYIRAYPDQWFMFKKFWVS